MRLRRDSSLYDDTGGGRFRGSGRNARQWTRRVRDPADRMRCGRGDPWHPCRWPMQDTITCPACKRQLALPPGVRTLSPVPRAARPNSLPSRSRWQARPRGRPHRRTARSADPNVVPAGSDRPAGLSGFRRHAARPGGGVRQSGESQMGRGLLIGILIGILRMVTAGGEAGKNQTVPGQGGQRSLREMQDHANRRGDRADALAKQLRTSKRRKPNVPAACSTPSAANSAKRTAGASLRHSHRTGWRRPSSSCGPLRTRGRNARSSRS